MNTESKSTWPHEQTGYLINLLASPAMSTGQLASLRRSYNIRPPAFYWVLARLYSHMGYLPSSNEKIEAKKEENWWLLVHSLAVLTPRGVSDRRVKADEAQSMIEEDKSAIEEDETASAEEKPDKRNRVPLGKALFFCGDKDAKQPGFSEGRLVRLLESKDRQFEELLVRMCRLLNTKQQQFDKEELAKLVLYRKAGTDAYERTRQKIVRDYYSAAFQFGEKQ